MNLEMITLRDYEIVLNQSAYKGKYFDCPECKEPAKEQLFNVWLPPNSISLKFDCYKCNYSGNIYTLEPNYNRASHYNKKPIVNKPNSSSSKEKKANKVLELLPALYNDLRTYLETNPGLSLIKEYSDLYFNLRGLSLPSDSLPLTPDFIKRFSYKYWFISKFKHYQLNFHKDINGNVIYFTPYLPENKFLEHKDELITEYHLKNCKTEYKNFKRLYPSGLKLRVSGADSLKLDKKPKRKILWITESFDKAQALIQLGYSAIGLGGINQNTALREFLKEASGIIKKYKLKVVISFDTRLELNSVENKASETIAGILKEFSITNVFKSNIPFGLEDKETQKDLDDYLKAFTNPKDKTNKVLELLRSSKKVKELVLIEYKAKNRKTYNPKKEASGIVKVTREAFQVKAIEQIENLEPNQHLLIKTQVGAGKNYLVTQYIKKNPNKRVLHLSLQKNLLDEIHRTYSENHIRVKRIRSFSDNCKEHHKVKSPNNNEFYNRLKALMSKDHETKGLCSQCPIRQGCLAIREKNKDSNDYTKHQVFLATFDKFKLNPMELIYKINPDLIIIDEAIEQRLIHSISLSISDYIYLKSKYSNSSSSKTQAIKILELLFDKFKIHSIKDKSKDLYKRITSVIPTFKKELDKISLNDLKLELELSQNDLSIDNLENLPHKKSLYSLIESLKNKCYNMAIDHGKITIYNRLDFDTKKISQPIVWLNATGRKELMINLFNIEPYKLLVNDSIIETSNIEIYQNTYRSWSMTSLKESKNKAFTMLKEITYLENQDDRKVFVVTTKDNSKKLQNERPENDNFTVKHHFSLRGQNHYKNFDTIVLTDTPVNEFYFELESKVLLNLTDNDLKSKNKYLKSSLCLDNGKNEARENKVYNNQLVNDYYKTKTIDELVQNAGRIIRDPNPKTTKKIIFLTQRVLENLPTGIREYNLNSKEPNIKYQETYNQLKDIYSKYLSENMYLDSKNHVEIKNIFLQKNTSVEVNFSKKDKAQTSLNQQNGTALYNIYIEPTAILAKLSDNTYRDYENKIFNELGIVKDKNQKFGLTFYYFSIDRDKVMELLNINHSKKDTGKDLVRPGKVLDSFSQTIGTQYLDTEIKEPNALALPIALSENNQNGINNQAVSYIELIDNLNNAIDNLSNTLSTGINISQNEALNDNKDNFILSDEIVSYRAYLLDHLDYKIEYDLIDNMDYDYYLENETLLNKTFGITFPEARQVIKSLKLFLPSDIQNIIPEIECENDIINEEINNVIYFIDRKVYQDLDSMERFEKENNTRIDKYIKAIKNSPKPIDDKYILELNDWLLNNPTISNVLFYQWILLNIDYIQSISGLNILNINRKDLGYINKDLVQKHIKSSQDMKDLFYVSDFKEMTTKFNNFILNLKS